MLLDTYIEIWATLDPAALSDTERKLMTATKAPLVLSADEMLLIQAQGEGMHLLTRDSKLLGHLLAAV